MSRFLPILLVLSLVAALQTSPLSAQEKQEETYSISLIQAAEAGKEVSEIDGRKILTGTYKVRTGDSFWKILREKGLINKQNSHEVIRILKQLNPSLRNIDLLHPNETVVIPLVVSPIREAQRPGSRVQGTPLPLEKLRDVDLELYTIQPGDSIIKVVKSKYNMAEREIHDEYLDLLKRMNPSLENIHRVFPGQKIRLPIYSPQVIRMPLPPPPVEAGPEMPSEPPTELMTQVADVFKAMGVEWLQGGQHFIPLKSGGQINLNADSFPIVNLSHGMRVIVDFKGGLPERMVRLITSNWENYRIVRVKPGDGLKEAIESIIAACGYPKVYRGNEALELPGQISLRIRADWIIRTAEEEAGRPRHIVLILTDPASARISPQVGRFLEEMGIRVVQYPPAGESTGAAPMKAETLNGGRSAREVIETVLRVAGQSFSRDAEIPVYQGRKSDFNMLVKADFLLSREGNERVIDLTGLGPEIVSLLKDHRFHVLRLEEHADPSSVVPRVLEFAGVPFDSKPHVFLAAEGDESKNITVTVPGITFPARDAHIIFFPTAPVPEPLAGFLSEKGYTILTVEP